jgi:hypothetical protein
MKRKLITLVLFFIISLSLSYCDNKKEDNDKPQNIVLDTSSSYIKIASFNIQVFGKTKLKNQEVMKYIVQIIKNFDIVAIQEIRSKGQEILPTLTDILGNNWDYRVSEPLGRTQSKEQYGFVYNKDKVKIRYCTQVTDINDVLHREPFICYCQAGNFDFSLINIHTDPDEVAFEINILDDILKEEINTEKDAIILGDFNASPDKFGELLGIEGISWAVPDSIKTNVIETKNYDNLVFIKTYLNEFVTGGVFNFKIEYNLDLNFAKKISDHLPVYGVFRIDLKDDD